MFQKIKIYVNTILGYENLFSIKTNISCLDK